MYKENECMQCNKIKNELGGALEMRNLTTINKKTDNQNNGKHEIVSANPDIDVRFYLSEDTGSYVAPHWHNSLEMVYMIEGKMQIQYDDGNKQYLTNNEFCIINPRVIHSVTSEKNKALVLQIPDTMLERYIPFHDLIRFEVSMNPKKAVDQTRLEKMKSIFTDMQVVYDIRPDAYLLKFYSLLYELLYNLVHS